MVYWFTRQLGGRAAGAVAAGALLFQPHFFFHSHMACFDVPVAALWFGVIYAYWRSFESRRWALATGVLWGLCLCAKLNAFFLPIVLVAHWLLSGWRDLSLTRADADGPAITLPRVPLAFISMALLGPLIFYLHWPRIWYDTFARVWWYMEFHLTHVHYFVHYFGQNLYRPPFPRSLPWGLTLVTVPPTLLLGAVIGAASWLIHYSPINLRRGDDKASEHDPRGTGLLLLINFLFSILLISMPKTPVFGGTKHWLPSMPFLAMMVGLGLVWAARHSLQRRTHQLALTALLAIATLTPAATATHQSYQYGISYYNELIGGLRGAADLGMARQFWGYASRGTLPWLNEHAPKNARVWTHDTTSWAFEDYKREGLVRQDLRPWGLHGSDISLLDEDKAFYFERYLIWEHYGTRAPTYVLMHQGVPLVSVYERPQPAK
jgi:4-amino-4-deoxy-L-arabinose transferase-like glycosyltransferase